MPEIQKDLDGAAIATIFLGANDASDDVQAVPVEEYGSNLKEIVEFFRKSGCEKVILIAPPPLDEALYFKEFLEKRGRTKVDRRNDLVVTYARKCAEVAEELGVPCLPLFDKVNEKAKADDKPLEYYFRDGLHLNAEGGEILFDELLLLIQRTMPEFFVTPCKYTDNPANSGSLCEALPPFGPWWDKIDPEAGIGKFMPSGDEPGPKKAKTSDE